MVFEITPQESFKQHSEFPSEQVENEKVYWRVKNHNKVDDSRVDLNPRAVPEVGLRVNGVEQERQERLKSKKKWNIK